MTVTSRLGDTARTVLTPAAWLRLAIGWGAVLALALAGPLLEPPVPGPLLVGTLAVIVGVILLCAFGVVGEAEHLARRLGDPYGSLVLTLSIVVIEVVLISAVMLGPGDHATIARDSVMAVSMIILCAVVGLSLLVGGMRHGDLEHNRTGTSSYLAVLVVLVALAFALPAAIGTDGSYTGGQAVVVVALTVVLYAFFLWRQTGAQADDFREVDPRVRQDSADGDVGASLGETFAAHRTEILLRAGLLVVTVLPIVLLSHDMAALLDDGLGRLGAPAALSGLLIACIVFLPESITSVRAALAGEVQRVSNLCHGALVSTVGLTIPAVLVIGALTGQQVVLAESPANLLLLGVALVLSVATFAGRRVTAVHGAVHLTVFAVYVLALFA
ncbi:calcium:proton antiporter [Georgenia sp. Z1344]|uniref:calcium:proton antiporter n=1 Tax=Georgenia sp. Z1344 TaxID=3416706 RepID=UPI003CFB5AE2